MVSKIKNWYENLSTINKLTLKNIWGIYSIILLMAGSVGFLFVALYGSIVYFDSIIPGFVLIVILLSVLIARHQAIEEYRDQY